MKQLKFFLMITVLSLVVQGQAQKAGLVNTSQSKYAALSSLNMGAVQFTKGFWADRFAICRDSMLPHLWDTYHNEVLCHSFRNFEIAAGLYPGKFRGPSFHDGDFYKTLEAVAAMYAVTKDYKLDTMMDHAIAVIANAAAVPFPGSGPTEAESLPARKIAQQVLKECAMNRDNFARGAAGITLLCAARIAKAVTSNT